MVLVFAPEQCDAALRVIERFNELYAERGEARIAGIVYTPYRQAALKALKAYDVRFPVLYDSLGVTREALGLYAYPGLFLVEGNRIVSRAELGGGDSDALREILAVASAP